MFRACRLIRAARAATLGLLVLVPFSPEASAQIESVARVFDYSEHTVVRQNSVVLHRSDNSAQALTLGFVFGRVALT